MTPIKLTNNNGVFSCDIGVSVDEWVAILQNKDVTTQNMKDTLIRFANEPNHEASCAALASKCGSTHNGINKTISSFGENVQKYLNRFSVIEANGDNQTFWPIPMGKGRNDQTNHFVWTLRPELVEAIERTHLTWIPFYKELAVKVLEYKNKRKELLQIVLDLPEEYTNYLTEYKGEKIVDIEPFSFFAIFNRGLKDERRIEICRRFKEVFNISAPLPVDFDGIPIANNQKSYFFRVKDGDGCDELWDLFEQVMLGKDDLTKEFNIAKDRRSVKWMSTIFLFWVNPDRFLPLDSRTRTFLKGKGVEVFKIKDLNWENYQKVCKQVAERFPNLTPAAISYEAFTSFNDSPLAKLVSSYKETLSKDPVRAKGNEIYKWELLEATKDADELSIVNLVKEQNVINQRLDKQVLATLLSNRADELKAAVGILFNEDIELDDRLAAFKAAMSDLCDSEFAGKKLNSKANDERVASAILACHNPAQYTFYKESYYSRLCELQNAGKKNAGSKYSHYLELIKPLVELIEDDGEIQDVFEEYYSSNLLIAQNILYITTNTDQIHHDLVEAVNSSEIFVTTKTPNPKKKFIWISGKERLFNNDTCHYEFIYTGTDAFGHKQNHLYVETHFENAKSTELFKTAIKEISETKPDVKQFYWGHKSCCNSLRINEEGLDLYSPTLIDDAMYELGRLDDAVGNILRKAIKKETPNTSMMENNKEIIDLLKAKKQIILQGAPGTGKTYRTAEIAVQLCNGTVIGDREKVMEQYNKLVEAHRIGFTTFHQSMDYEEFIEGIKPINENGTISYEVKRGIFLDMCNYADTDKMIVEGEQVEISPAATIWKVSLCQTGDNEIRTDCLKNGYIRIGWDKYGDFSDEDDIKMTDGKGIINAFRNKMQIGDIVFSCYTHKVIDAIGVVTGDYEWRPELKTYMRVRTVKWLVKDIRKDIYELNKTVMTLSTVYRLKNINIEDVKTILKEFNGSKESKSVEEKLPYVLIIDEINRGNISKIFGELITLLEADKRKGKLNRVKAKLAYSHDEDFSVPDNLYIIGTMNTADRSIGYIDYAVRRRFAFYTFKADRSVIENYAEGASIKESALKYFDDIKTLIENHISPDLDPEDLMIGHSYFLASSDEELKMRIEYEVKPLLYEYANDGVLVGLKREKGKYQVIEEICK